MAARQSRVRGHIGRGERRKTTWVGPAIQGFVNVASGGSTIISSATNEEPETVVRVRGMVAIEAQSYAADLGITGAFGMGIVSAEAFAIGITAVPKPFANADWGGWLVWRSFGLRFESITQAGVLLASWSMEIDSKAMRKAVANEVLVSVAESQGGAFALFDGTRVLTMLH